MVEACETTRCTPISGRNTRVRREKIWSRAAIDACGRRLYRLPRFALPTRESSIAWLRERSFIGRAPRAKAVGCPMHLVDELAPTEHLSDESLLARNRKRECRDVVHDLSRKQPMQIHQRRNPRVEDPAAAATHRVFVRAKVGQARLLRPIPKAVDFGARRGNRRDVERTRMPRESGLDD
jgi:hypothetical protein